MQQFLLHAPMLTRARVPVQEVLRSWRGTITSVSGTSMAQSQKRSLVDTCATFSNHQWERRDSTSIPRPANMTL